MFANDSQLYLGTSSWTADGWVDAFYPEDTKPADFLEYYSRHFNCAEIDSTFYRIPTAKTVEKWRERTPKGLVFAAKAPRAITHQKVLVGAGPLRVLTVSWDFVDTFQVGGS